MRKSVELRHAYRLLNHGPTTLVTSAANGKANVMAAAWVMPVDYDPPKVAAVIDGKTWTRELVDASGEFGLSVPGAALADLTWTVGKISGREVDKIAAYGVKTFAATKISAPLIEGAVAWLECRVLPEREIETRYDLFVAEVVAAWAEDAVFANGVWTSSPRTIHHQSKGSFFLASDRLEATELRPR